MRWQRGQPKLDFTQRGHVVFDNQREVILHEELNLVTKVRTLDKVIEVFQGEFTLNNLVVFLYEVHAVRLASNDLHVRIAPRALEDQLTFHRFNL